MEAELETLVNEETFDNDADEADKTIATEKANDKTNGNDDKIAVVTTFVVNDIVCDDKTYATKLDVEQSELLEVLSVAGQVGTSPGEVTMEVRPQYCTFSSQGLAEKLRKMGLFVSCLPWVANNGRH